MLAIHLHEMQGDEETAVSEMPTPPPRKQPRIDEYIDNAAREAYLKLMKTAYELAVNAMPFRDFHVLTKVQKLNGVSLIEGKDSDKVAKDLIYCLADVVKEKLALILTTKKVFSSMSDGSQARKTGADKELLFIRVERAGVPVYYCIGLEDLGDHGGANAAGVKSAHDKVFGAIDKDIYTRGLLSCTADGASVNFGRWDGFLVKMTRDDRPWLVQIHCVNHRAELAAKSTEDSTAVLAAANETNRCESLNVSLMSHITVGPALFCILVLCFLRKRTFFHADKCHGRPGLQYPVNFIDEHGMRWAYVAAFGILGDTIGNMFISYFIWMPGKFVSDSPLYDEQFVEDFGWLRVFVVMVNVIEVSVIYYPLFACIAARKHIIANLFGIAFSLYWFITTVIFWSFCSLDGLAGIEVTMSRILQLMMSIPLLLCTLVVLLSNILSLYHNVREVIDKRNRSMSILLKVTRVATIAKNLAEPVPVKQPECMQYLKELFDQEKPIGAASLFTRLKERIFYRKIQGFKYSPRVVCTMVTAAFILYKFMIIIVMVSENMLDQMDELINYVQVTDEIRDIVLAIFNADMFIVRDFIHLSGRILRIELYCALMIALAIQIFNMIHMIFCYRKHLRNLYRGNRNWMFQDLGSPAAVVVNSLRYSGYQIAYIGWGYLILAIVLFLVMVIFTYLLILPLVFGYETFLTRRLKTLAAVLVISILLYILQLLLAKFFFLRERGRYLALTNRRVFHLLNFFMFTFNVIVGIFACLKRIVFSLIFGIIMLGRIDRSSIMRDWERFDVGYKAYLGMLELDIAHNHPVLQAFIHILRHKARKRRLAREILGEDLSIKPKLWPRNKWHLSLTLMWNRQLTVDRILQLQRIEVDTYGKRNSSEELSLQPNGKIDTDISNDSIRRGDDVPVNAGYVNNGTCFDDNIETATDVISDAGLRQRQQPHVTFHMQSEDNTLVDVKPDDIDVRYDVQQTYL